MNRSFAKLLIFLIFSLAFFLFFLPAKADTSVNKIIKILLVPGHDNQVWGAQYGNTKEADMTLAVATEIYNILKLDKRFDVHITRDKNGYTKEFADYFPAQKDAILTFEQSAKKVILNKISKGSFIQKINTPHHKVTEDIALRLYGFNKWANENGIDAVIHVHFNDYPLPNKWSIGQYKGFAVYMPDTQFTNAKESAKLATDIFTQLHKKYSPSNYKQEKGGLVSDQKLIAIGAYGTLSASVRSVLIEYSYIYEKMFRVKSTRLEAYQNMANLTATGIENYFFPNK